MNNSQYYVLKYNLKYALDDPKISDNTKKQIREAEKISKGISNSIYGYALADLAWTMRNYRKNYSHNSHLLQKHL